MSIFPAPQLGTSRASLVSTPALDLELRSSTWTELVHEAVTRLGVGDIMIDKRGKSHVKIKRQTLEVTTPNLRETYDDLLAMIYADRPAVPELGLRALDSAFGSGDRRFRCSRSRHAFGEQVVLRVLPNTIPTPEAIHLPRQIVTRFCDAEEGGLCLVVGSTGSGKTTTAASLISEYLKRNARNCGTMEDPVEYIHPSYPKGRIIYREIGQSCESFGSALHEMLRQSVDLAYVGEIRDEEAAEAALDAALSGHLVLGTIHGASTWLGLDRLATLLAHSKNGGREALGSCFRMAIAQRLVFSGFERPLCAVREILLRNQNAQSVATKIRNGDFVALKSDILGGGAEGMMTFEQSTEQARIHGLLPRPTFGAP